MHGFACFVYSMFGLSSWINLLAMSYWIFLGFVVLCAESEQMFPFVI